jgi:hypothetical protein
MLRASKANSQGTAKAFSDIQLLGKYNPVRLPFKVMSKDRITELNDRIFEKK